MANLRLWFAVEETTEWSAAIIAAFESHADARDYCDMIAARHMENGRDNGDHCDIAATTRGCIITQTFESGGSMVTSYSVVPMDDF